MTAPPKPAGPPDGSGRSRTTPVRDGRIRATPTDHAALPGGTSSALPWAGRQERRRGERATPDAGRRYNDAGKAPTPRRALAAPTARRGAVPVPARQLPPPAPAFSRHGGAAPLGPCRSDVCMARAAAPLAAVRPRHPRPRRSVIDSVRRSRSGGVDAAVSEPVDIGPARGERRRPGTVPAGPRRGRSGAGRMRMVSRWWWDGNRVRSEASVMGGIHWVRQWPVMCPIH